MQLLLRRPLRIRESGGGFFCPALRQRKKSCGYCGAGAAIRLLGALSPRGAIRAPAPAIAPQAAQYAFAACRRRAAGNGALARGFFDRFGADCPGIRKPFNSR